MPSSVFMFCGDYILHELWYGIYIFGAKIYIFPLRATPCGENINLFHAVALQIIIYQPPFTQGSLWFVRSESLSAFPDKHCFCGHKSEAPHEQKLGYNVIKALKSSVSLIGSKQRLLFKHRMKSSISVISESVTGCSSSISENSGEVNFIVFW